MSLKIRNIVVLLKIILTFKENRNIRVVGFIDLFILFSFQYLWRIPVNEIDRPGCFCTHICRGVELLLDVLYKLNDSSLLLHVSAFLHKTPDKDK